eukprot:Hpha_TRINITY_DN4154_c0_g1::TRINITY_DN4154_c0_g1_i1::g.194727::m.194727
MFGIFRPSRVLSLLPTRPCFGKKNKWDRLLGSGIKGELNAFVLPEDSDTALRDQERELKVIIAEAQDDVASARMIKALANPYVDEDAARARRTTDECVEEFDSLLAAAPQHFKEALRDEYRPIIEKLKSDVSAMEDCLL